MKTNFCVVNYNIITNEWNLYIETPLENYFFEYKSKTKCIEEAKKKSKQKKVFLWIYNKNNFLIEKIDYT